MLGLVAMATTAECLYASVKALVCTVGGNSVALKDMERSGGFKVCWGSYERMYIQSRLGYPDLSYPET